MVLNVVGKPYPQLLTLKNNGYLDLSFQKVLNMVREQFPPLRKLKTYKHFYHSFQKEHDENWDCPSSKSPMWSGKRPLTPSESAMVILPFSVEDFPMLIGKVFNVVDGLVEDFPMLIRKVFNMVDGLVEVFPMLIQKVFNAVNMLVEDFPMEMTTSGQLQYFFMC